MAFKSQDICTQFAELIISTQNLGGSFTTISAVEDFDSDSLIFVSNLSQLPTAEGTKPSVIITHSEVAESIMDQSLCVITVADVRLAQALIKKKYQDYDAVDSEWESIHSSAVIHPTAQLGDNVRIGANSVIGKDVFIGSDTVVRANCVIEHGARVGSACTIHNLVNIGIDCILGDRVIIRPGAIIGNEGFGFARDELKRYHRVPHTGVVEIGNDVQIGSNCNIDRGTYGKTVIANGVKVDALCHIAHNVFVDENTIFVAQTGVAGSTKVGKRVVASGQTGMLDHRTVVDDVVMVHRCGVTEDILEPGLWAGTPPKRFKEYVRGLRIDKRIAALQQELDELKNT